MSLNLDLYHTANIVYPVETANKNHMLCNILLMIPLRKLQGHKKRKTLSIYHRQEGVIINTQILIFNIPHPIFTDQEKLIIFKKSKIYE